jgi:predicted dehydrogenase
MRIGIAGLNALYWPISIGDGLQGKPGVYFLAAASLGEKAANIRGSLGLSPEDYADRYGIRLYDRAEEMIAQEGLDTVAIVVPHSQHADWVERLAALGVNLYLPKTFATTPEDAERIVRAEKRFGIKIAVGPSARFLPQMAAVKQALDDGLIGVPFSLRICHHHGTIDGFHQNDWYRHPDEGGPELSLGWYGIDLAIHLMGDKVKTVFASYGNYTTPGSPFMDCGRMVMEMERGGVASFDMYFCNRMDYPAWQLEIVGPKGVISIHRTEGEVCKTIVSFDGDAGHKILQLPQKTPHWEMFWVDEIAQRRDLSLTAEYARQVTLISLAACQSSRTGMVVEVPDKGVYPVCAIILLIPRN